MKNIIEIEGLKKYYGDVKAVDGIDLAVEEGSLFAFLGLNGAGKSTTINIMCSLLRKDCGKVTIDGYDLDRQADRIKSLIGMVFQNSVLDARLSVKDNLSVRASFYGLCGKQWKERLEELTELFALKELLNRAYGKLSGGQRRRVDLARGIINRPKVLILDEPTTGLDPQTRISVWQIVQDLRKNDNMTVFLTTHYMEEANRADRVVIIDNGKIAAGGSPSELKENYSSDYVKLFLPRTEQTDKRLADHPFEYEDHYYRIKVANSVAAKGFLARFDDLTQDFEVVKGDMDDVFLQVTGKNLIGGGAQ